MNLNLLKSKKNNNLDMTEGKPLRLMLAFALPLMFGNIFQQLYTVVDTAIVGRGVGMEALAALGTVDWLNWMMLAIAQGFTQGFSVRVAQKFGMRDMEGLHRTLGQSAKLTAILAVTFPLLALAVLPLFTVILRVPEELRPMSQLYSGILFAGLSAVVFYNYCAAILRAVGDSKTPLKAMMIASAVNIALDLLAVFVLNWGIAGAAIATVIAQIFSGIFCALKIRTNPALQFSRKDMAPDRILAGKLLRLAVPLAAKSMIVAWGGIAVQAVANGFGTTFIAGFAATNKLYGPLETAAISYGYAITTYVGQNYGAGRHDRIRSGMKSASILSILTSLVITLIAILFGRPITSLFISSDVPELAAEAGEIAYDYLFFISLFLSVLYLLHAYMAALQGIGDTLSPMYAGIIELLLRVAIALCVGWIGFEYGIFLTEVAAWTGGFLFVFFRYRQNMRKTSIP